MARGSVLVVAPHPDDETFGCGGTIATLAASGMDVYVELIVQHGINTGGPASARVAADRGTEFALACSKLGVSDFHVMIEDGELPGKRPALHCVVADEGPGIPDGELEAIFDKFTQSSKTANGAGGSGLGLAICREIVHLHNGKIWASNAASGGAIINLLLPRDLALPDTGAVQQVLKGPHDFSANATG